MAAAERCSEASDGRYRIELVTLPTNADEQREQLVRRLAAEDSDIDLISMDVIWTAEFAEAGWILPVPGRGGAAGDRGPARAGGQSATYEDRLYAAPFTSNTQLLWYRKSLTPEPPTTWEADARRGRAARRGRRAPRVPGAGPALRGPRRVVHLAARVGRHERPRRERHQGRARAGGRPSRRSQVMRDLSRSSAAPPALSTAREDDGRLAWESGTSAFMTNYTFVWPSANANAPGHRRGHGLGPVPGHRGRRPEQGHDRRVQPRRRRLRRPPDLAFEAAACITSEENQLEAAIKGGLLPTSEALYDDPELTEATQEVTDATSGETKEVKTFPYADVLKETLADAVQRPQTPFYNDVSLAIARTLHPTVDIDPQADVDRLRDAIERALKGEGLL